ncbi:MAG TPA: 16S rRNA (cytosine(1402)-N(4))-methyltransferase RsmH [Acidimicrobiales bacterium]|nr:16S rRNA (cytosine(1402)-N(4))-methyltransferase RsmH [Acidimicrobiales bacterium]
MRSLPTGSVEDSSSALFPVGRRGPYPGRTLPVGGLRMAQAYSHQPVLVDEVSELLAAVPPGVVIDGTVGGAGHARALLERRDDVVVLGLDRDPAAVEAASEALAGFGRRAIVRRARFSAMAVAFAAAQAEGALRSRDPVTGVLLDLGVSSHQLDTSDRGFSYRTEGPLDMRMGPDDTETAAEYLARVDEATLASLLVANGEGRFGRSIARSILAASPTSTAELAAAVERAVPAASRRHGHVASRTFQALRVAVNRELEELAEALAAARSLLVAGGRLVVISYHSGEDALVKSTLRDAATGGCECPPQLPCGCGAVPTMRLVTRGSHKATPAEVAQNPRSRSARLRAAEQLEEPTP